MLETNGSLSAIVLVGLMMPSLIVVHQAVHLHGTSDGARKYLGAQRLDYGVRVTHNS